MANISTFLNELSTQHQQLKNWFNELTQSITDMTNAVNSGRAKRQELMAAHVAFELPNLRERTVDAANRRFPAIISRLTVGRFITLEQDRIQAQINALPAPEMFGLVARETVVRRLAGRQALLEAVQEAYEEYTSIPALTDLVARAYGTPEYRCRWYQLQYYRDWKRSDEIVEQLNMKRWGGVRDQLIERRDVLRDSTSAHDQDVEKLKAIEDLQKRSSELTVAMTNVQVVALEKMQTMLRAAMEGDADKPQAIAAMDRAITQDEERLNALRTQRDKVTEKLERIDELRTKVSHSRRKDVPDEYVERVRRDNTTSQQTVYIERQDDWLSNYLYYSTMMNLFDQHRQSYSPGPNYAPTSTHPGSGSDHVTESRYGSAS